MTQYALEAGELSDRACQVNYSRFVRSLYKSVDGCYALLDNRNVCGKLHINQQSDAPVQLEEQRSLFSRKHLPRTSESTARARSQFARPTLPFC